MPRLPGCCRLHDNRVRARRRSERVVSSSETKSPRPHTGRAPGRRRWNSSGKAADVAGGPCPGPGSADVSAAPRLQAGSPRGELAQCSVLFPSGHPARFSQRGVNSSWVAPQRPAPWGWGGWGECVFAQTSSFPLLFPDRLLGRIRASQPGHVWSNVKGSSGSQSSPGDSPGCPRYLVPAGAKETAPITREPSVWVVKAVKGLRGGGDPAGDGLHRPLLGK